MIAMMVLTTTLAAVAAVAAAAAAAAAAVDPEVVALLHLGVPRCTIGTTT